MRSTAIFFLLFFISTLNGQLYYETYDWDDTLDISNYAVNEDEDAITFKDVFITEFAFENENLVEYRLAHTIKFLNSDEQIERNNKIYLPINYSSELVLTKARVISPENKVQILDESMILTAKDDEQQQSYSFFALEGVKKGSFIEYYYVLKTTPSYKGKRISFQNDQLKNNVSFKLLAPKHLIFDFKSYNKFPDASLDTSYTNKNVWGVDVKSIAPLIDEKESTYAANKQYIVYKLEKNTDRGTSNIISYNNAAKLHYDHLNPELSKKETSNIEKFQKKIKIDKKNNTEGKIRSLEDFLKKEI